MRANREIAESSQLGVLRKHVLEVALLPITTMLAMDVEQAINFAYGFLDRADPPPAEGFLGPRPEPAPG